MNERRTPAHNKVLPKIGVTRFYEASVLNRTFVLHISSSTETTILGQYQKRYLQSWNTDNIDIN